MRGSSKVLEGMLAGSTAKDRGSGSHRARPPAQTRRLIEPHLDSFGITRVANVTGLDRLGIPVFMVVRPNSRSLAVAQGKGIDPDSARVSGIMESVECWHAEFASLSVVLESRAELSRRAAVLEPSDLPLARGSLYHPHHALPWVQGFDLLAGEPVWVPHELVHASTVVPLVPGSGCFVRSTNGLASGNVLVEAFLHGLCELVERDGIALDEGDPAGRGERRIDLSSVDDPLGRELLDRYERAGFAVAVWDATTDAGVPVLRAVIYDLQADAYVNPYPAAQGMGCHPARGVALVRALTEAAQSRLTYISGARDDMTRVRYRVLQAAANLDRLREVVVAESGEADFRRLPDTAHGTLEEDAAWILDRLRSIGVTRVAAVDLSRPGLPVHVVRTIATILEGPSESPAYRPGRRARARAAS